ncbi:MAG: nucleotidyltransferase domain-containing protein [Verrucomicrobiota bacterium]|nr:nucleotidyltransferase domain-containing protein [Verrucomicrobiota bacterium]
MIEKEIINIVATKLVETYNPIAIFLFGSYAWGNPTDDSDLDIMIILDDSDEKSYVRPRKGFQALRGLKIAKDIIVYTKNEFNAYLRESTSLPYKIKNEGISLYARD